MFGAVLPSLLIGFGTTKSTWASEPTLSWNQIVRIAPVEAITHSGLAVLISTSPAISG